MDATYQDLIQKVGKDHFQSRFKELLKSIHTFLNTAGYPDYVYCDEQILNQVLLDYYSDIYDDVRKIKDF